MISFIVCRIWFAPLFLALACTAAAAQTKPEAAISAGQVRGRALAKGGAVFKGIPFAQPPIAELRWREPQPVKPWADVHDAGESGHPCAQPSQGWNEKFASASSEDCLYLDVWAPQWPAKSPKPVMVWIHGGGNVAGAGGFDPLYNGEAFIRHDVVLVLIQYRLGIFGFFAHPELTRESTHQSSGNYAILDQIAALQWVHDNIVKFGGDPGNVTVFGQSAGSLDALLLMTSPLSKGLFHRVIGESGAISPGPTPSLSTAEQAGAMIGEKLKAPSTGALRYLRSLSTADLLQSEARANEINLEMWVFTSSPWDVFRSGKQHQVPLLLGTNAIEFPAEGSADDLRKRVGTEYGDSAPKAITLYGLEKAGSKASDPVYGNAADQIGAEQFRCNIGILLEEHSASGNPAWSYQFDRAIPPRPKVGHSSELPYVFGNLYGEGSQAGDFQEGDRKLSETMQTYWTNFARTGDPNGAGVQVWPRFDAKSRKYLEFTTDAGVKVNANQRSRFCDLLREQLSKRN